MNLHYRMFVSTAAACLLLVGCDNKSELAPAVSSGPAAPSTNTAAATPAPATSNAPAPTAVKPAFATLVGKWQRVDGDYLLEIKSVESSGKLDAHYFNPKPINVSQAAALQKDGGTQVFIELRDVNYPGSTYTLAYDPKSDQMFGQYFQAAMKQTFDVTFERVKAP